MAIACCAIEFSILTAPKLRIAEIMFAVSLGQIRAADNRILLQLLKIHAVSNGNALRLQFLMVRSGELYAGIHQHQPTIFQRKRRARKTSARIRLGIGRQCRGKIRPAEQIPAFGMPPVHRSPYGIIGMVLVEQMIFALIIAKAIRIVHPTDHRRQVDQRTVFFRNLFAGFTFEFSCGRKGSLVLNHIIASKEF